MAKPAKSKSAAAKAAARGTDLRELMPEVAMLKKAGLAELIKSTAEGTGAPVRVEYRHGRGWLIAVGGNVIGDVDTDPIALLGDAASKASS
jgi:hypothetical protein